MCVETISQEREIRGVRGAHIMAVAWESGVSPIPIVEEVRPLPPPCSSR
jgi:hypothetical protein